LGGWEAVVRGTLRGFAGAVLISGAVCAAADSALAACSTGMTAPKTVVITGQLSEILIDDKCQYVYAANIETHRVEVYALQTGQLLSAIPVGRRPTSMDTSPDGLTLYVANAGESGTGPQGSVSVIDLTRHVETNRVTILSRSAVRDHPYSVAVAQSGRVLLTIDAEGSAYSTAPVLQIDPASQAVSYRNVSVSDRTRLKASADRSVIGLAHGNSTGGEVQKYNSAGDSFSEAVRLNKTLHDIGFDRTGNVAIVRTANSATLALDSSLQVKSTLPGAGDVVLDPDGAKAYATSGLADFITVYDIASATKTGAVPIGESFLSAAQSPAISRDGTLIALINDRGFAVVPVVTPQPPTLQLTAFSSLHTGGRSLLRFHNTDVTGTLRLTLSDASTGLSLATWTSPQIAPNTAVEYTLSMIEAGATPQFTPRERYALSIESSFSGTFSHLLRDTNGALANVTVCNANIAGPTTKVANLFNSLDADHESFLRVLNTAPTTASPQFIFRDGFVTSPPFSVNVATNAAVNLYVPGLEQALRIQPTAGARYRVEATGSNLGTFLPFERSKQTGIFVDMTAACALRKWVR
jgi:DNA-binding beta-propeller fold protein YncE